MSARTARTASSKDQLPEMALAAADEFLTPERLDRILNFDGGALPIVSAYIAVPPTPGDAHHVAVTKADSLLHEIRAKDDRTMDHDARLSLREDIANIKAVVDLAANIPETLAIVSCSRAGMLEVVRLPRAVRDRIVVDETPWVRPLVAMLDEYRRCFAVLVDRESAHAWELYLGQLRDAGPLPRSSTARRAGLQEVNQRRAPHKAETYERRYLRLLTDALEELLAGDRNAVLALGGHEDELARFRELLPRALQERLAGTFTVDHSAVTLGAIEEQAGAVLERYELDQQRRRVADVFEAAAAGGHGAVGLDACLWAASVAAVQTLYVQEGAICPGVVCDRSRWLALTGECCPVCGAETRQTPDVINELTEAVIEEGGSVSHVRAETELAERLAACALRFELPSRA
jgi:peptide chain release factor subunit 1